MTEHKPTKKTTPSDRLDSLDCLRGIAALLVVLFHYTVMFGDFYPNALPSPVKITFGSYGVHLFFMISGFVILMSLNRNKGDGFIRGRFIRLFPIFWASVLLTALIGSASPLVENDFSIIEIAVNLTMLHDYFRVPAVDGVYWSLSYELGFYFALYAIFKLGVTSRIDALPAFFSCLALVFVFVTSLVPHPLHYLLVFNAYGHLFACGMAFFFIRNNGLKIRWGIVVLAAPIIQFLHDGTAGAIAVAISSATMAAATTMPIKWDSKYLRPLTYFGAISYALYLTHQMIGYEIMAHLQLAGLSWWATITITLAIATAIAHGLTFLIETFITPRLKNALAGTKPDPNDA